MHKYKYKYIYILLFGIFINANNIFAQNNIETDSTEFTNLIPADYPITSSSLPLFSIQKEIKPKSIDSTYEVLSKQETRNFQLKEKLEKSIKISIIYPEFESLSKSEISIIKRSKFIIPNKLTPNIQYGISKKKALVDISFCPILRKGQKYMRLKSFKLRIDESDKNNPQNYTHTTKENVQQNILSFYSQIPSDYYQLENKANRWKSNSILKSGKWIKIYTEDEGIYQITSKQILQYGFSDINRIKIYGYGGRIIEENWDFTSSNRTPDDLCEVATYRQNNTIYFFAEGITRWNEGKHENNPYSKYSYYFITEGDTPLQINEIATDARPLSSCSVVTHHVVLDNDKAGMYEGGRELYDGHNFAEGNPHTFNINTPNITSYGDVKVDIAFAASGKSSTTLSTTLNETYRLSNMTINAYGSDESARESRKSFNIPAINFKGNNSFRLSISPITTARLNYIRIYYPRFLNATDEPYSFSANKTGAIQLKIASSSTTTRLWQIANADEPTKQISATLNDSAYLIANVSDGTRRFVIFDSKRQYPSPLFYNKIVENQNLHADSAIQMVIIIPTKNDYTEEAQRLAQAHQTYQKLNVKIVRAEQLYNEFSSGTPDASAYRRYIKMLYDKAKNEKDLPRYLLFMGPSSWDNRMATPSNEYSDPDNFLLSFEVSHNASNILSTSLSIGDLYSYVTDDFFTWMDDNEGENYVTNKPDIAVGRIPCKDLQTAHTMVNKSIAYLIGKSQGMWQSKVYVLGDDKDNNLHMRGAEDVAQSITNSSNNNLLVHKVYWDTYPRTYTATGYSYPQATRQLQRFMNEGALIFDYIGHGSPDQISHAKVLVKDDFNENNSKALPLWIMASCKISPFDNQGSDIGRVALFNPNGGAVAVLSASRSVIADRNVELNTRFCQYLLNKGENTETFGEALMKAKTALVSNSIDVTINKLKYTLLGDPALPIALPKYQIILDSINGKELSENSFYTINACSLARFSGHIENIDNQIANSFNGTIGATLSDKLEDIVCKNNSNANQAMNYQDRTNTLIEISDSVKQGYFQINVPISRDISYTNSSARITFLAVDTLNNISALGFNEQFCLNGTENGVENDTIPPVVFIALNNDEFPDGGISTNNPYFIARISDNVAINTSDTSLGHNMQLCIDNDVTQTYNLNPYFNFQFGSYNKGDILWQMPTLSTGSHSIEFKVWDINNNVQTKYLNFYIGDISDNIFDVNATENFIDSGTNFIIHLPCEKLADNTQVLFEIYDIYGRRIWSKEKEISSSCHIVSWQASDMNGAPIPAGIYLYRATFSNINSKGCTSTKKIIVK